MTGPDRELLGEQARRLVALISDLNRVTRLPVDDPGRAAWLSRKEALVDDLNRSARSTPT